MKSILRWLYLFAKERVLLCRSCGMVLSALLAVFMLLGSSMTLPVQAAAASVHEHEPKVVKKAIIPGGSWTDTEGHSLQAHGAGLIKVGEKYYWFGENRTDNNWLFEAISCYSSTDLVH
jgi:hypothetical protein